MANSFVKCSTFWKYSINSAFIEKYVGTADIEMMPCGAGNMHMLSAAL